MAVSATPDDVLHQFPGVGKSNQRRLFHHAIGGDLRALLLFLARLGNRGLNVYV